MMPLEKYNCAVFEHSTLSRKIYLKTVVRMVSCRKFFLHKGDIVQLDEGNRIVGLAKHDSQHRKLFQLHLDEELKKLLPKLPSCSTLEKEDPSTPFPVKSLAQLSFEKLLITFPSRLKNLNSIPSHVLQDLVTALNKRQRLINNRILINLLSRRLSSITLPENTSIQAALFISRNCRNVVNLDMRSCRGLPEVGYSSIFYNCVNLRSLAFPK